MLFVPLAASVLCAVSVWADLTVTIIGPPSFNDTDFFKFTTKITNTGTQDVTLLNDPNSAVAPKFATNIFEVVSDDGTPAKFNGIALKWDQESAIVAKDFTVVKAGESVEIEQDYSGVYDFSESGERIYKIDGGGDFQVVSPFGEVTPYAAAVTAHTVKVAGKLKSSKTWGASSVTKRAVAHGCRPAQIQVLGSTLPRVDAYVSGAISYLRTRTQATPRFTTWFGVYSAARRNTVLDHYSRIKGDATSSSITYDCSTCAGTPNRGAYAFVFPNQPNRIFLCSAFWMAPISGKNSKAGTIVHQLSHFNANGGTRDFTHGQTAAAALARSNPDRAIMNAGSYEYFAENSPTRA